ncbi:Zn-ribbon RNA-binding protein [Cenarchaeum symbiosum A]|uniref:Zn-ribbon RNA-binding protein n=1 Tax=Cenarchaeum symbiosum (strain A) TaxID=414004 RepID=A0RUZ1_CENSY|nr:Zn-ribbon RNA-binding protein [Cenarchaeum symbiosum A]
MECEGADQARYKCAPPRPTAMSSSITLPVCSCCKRHIMPNDMCVKFDCPSCAGELVWRCESCREAARGYECSKCHFAGP